MLAELLTSDDEPALIRFLLACNITLGNEGRASQGRPTREAWQPGAMRTLGTLNVQRALSIHEAALDFIDRHLRRIRRRARSASVSGIPAVMHVARAVADVARAQLVRLTIGLELTRQVISADLWKRCRDVAGEYLVRTQELLECVTGYANGLKRRGDGGKVRAELAPDIAPLHASLADLLGIRERLAACGLRVRTSTGIVPAPYFASDLLREDRFHMWATGVRAQLDALSN